MAALKDVSLAVAFTILSVEAMLLIAVPSVSVALSPLLLIAVMEARPSTALELEVSSTAM